MKKINLIILAACLINVFFFVETQRAQQENNSNELRFRDRLLPAPVNGGFKMKDYWIWCGSVIKGEDGKYHMFASRWTKGLSFTPHWLTNSEVVRAVADKPGGPYAFQEVVLPPRGPEFWDGRMTHNPTIHKYGDKYLLFYTGTTYPQPMPTPAAPVSNESETKLYAHYHERIGVAISNSVYGPWKRFDKPILDVRKGKWDSLLVSNAAPVVLPNGKIYLFYKGVTVLTKHAISVAVAEKPEGPYVRIADEPFDLGVDAEDPTIWFENGHYHALMLDTGKKFSKKEIYYATSNDLLHWSAEENPIAVSKKFAWDDGQIRKMTNTERPQILVQDGKSTHVFFATGMDDSLKVRSTWSQVVPLKPLIEK
jgi:predicted GH43/DUF377 family glycosyl hydrolase